MTKERREAAIYVRLTQTELDRLDAIAERYPFLTRSGLAREAMRLGLDAIERQGLGARDRAKRKGHGP
jgi:hypothetical protein